MFDNARTYNQEGSWVYVDAGEMEKVFEAMLAKVSAGTDLPGGCCTAPVEPTRCVDVWVI
jgi:hypothetical protein